MSGVNHRYSPRLEEILDHIEEDGVASLYSDFDKEEIEEVAKNETNEEGKMWLEKILLHWDAVVASFDTIHEELIGNWDQDAYEQEQWENMKEKIKPR